MNSFSFNTFLLVISTFVGVCHVNPAPTLISAFELGKERSYTLTNELRLTDLRPKSTPSEYHITGKIKVATLWENDNVKLIRFQLQTPTLHVRPVNTNEDVKSHKSILDSTLNNHFYVKWDNGVINKFYSDPNEDASLTNMKKGVASLFQYQLLDLDMSEEDVAGRCEVSYQSKSETEFIKTKSKCTGDDQAYHQRLDRPLAVAVYPVRTMIYDVDKEGDLEKSKSKEVITTYLESNHKVGTKVESNMEVKFTGKTELIDELKGNDVESIVKTLGKLQADNVLSKFEKYCHIERDCTGLVGRAKEHKSALGNDAVGKESLALAMIDLLDVTRDTKKEDLLRVLNANSMQEMKSQLLDMLGATQTMAAHQVAKQVLKFESESDLDNCERYLQSLAVGTRPNSSIIEDLITLTEVEFENDKVKDTLFQTIASMAQRYALTSMNGYESDIVIRVEKFILFNLKKCKKPECKLIYIRALQNLKSRQTISVLFKIVLDEDKTLSVAAIKALRVFPSMSWSAADRKQFENIFFQKKKRFDSTVRTISLEILLSLRPDENKLKAFLEFLKSADKEYEVKQYLLQRVRMMADECSEFKTKLDQIIKSDPTLNNYHILGQRGLTTALSRRFSKSPSFNATLLSVQEMSSGVLKTGLVDLLIEAGDDKYSVFSLGMYAGGLSSFVGGGNKDDEDTEEDTSPATAGMEIIVQGSYLRPLQFFSGQGELMGHVWSGTASDPTPAYQATTLLHDHNEFIRLQNGVIVVIKVVGAVSIDLNGQVRFSLWNRNAKSKVEKNAGYAVIGRTSLDTSFVALRSEFKITQEPKLNLETDLDFSSNIMLCMQLSQPENVLRHDITKTVLIPKTKYKTFNRTKLTYKIPGLTQALNQKNNEMCNEIGS